MRIARLLVVPLTLGVLAAGLAATPAHAGPTSPLITPQTEVPFDPSVGLSVDSMTENQQRDYDRSKAIRKKAMNGSAKVLNYAKAKKAVTAKTWRRQFVAAWDWTPGTKITHISDAERKRIKSIQNRFPKFSEVGGASAQRSIACRGSNKVIKNYKGHRHDTLKYLDSCRTAALIVWYDVVAGDLGLMAAFIPQAATFLAIAAVVVLFDRAYLTYWQDRSDIGAIYFRRHNFIGYVRGQ